MYNLFWDRITNILKNSILGRIYLAIVHFISGAFKNSWFYNFFTNKSMLDYAHGSRIAQTTRKLIYDSSFSQIVSQSFFVRTISELSETVFSSPMYVLSFYILPSSILLFLRCFGDMTYMVVYSIAIVLGIILLSSKIKVGKIISDSVMMKGFCNFFNIETEFNLSPRISIVCVFAAIAGLIPVLASCFLSVRLTLILFIAILLLPLLFSSPLLMIVLTLLSGMMLSTLPAAALATVTVLLVICRVFTGKEKPANTRAVSVLVMLYLFLTLFYTFNGFGGGDSILAGGIHFIFLSLFFAITTAINNREKFSKLIFSFSTCTLYTSFFGIYQLLTGQGGTGWSNDEEYVGGLRRISSTFSNPNVYGEFLIFAICITLVSIFLAKKIRSKAFFAVCLCLQAINLALTYSRGCYIAVVLSVLIIIWCCDKRLLGFGIFGIPIIPKVLPKNILTRIISVGSYLKDSSVTYRFSIWNASLRLIKNHWFIGSGVGTVAFTAFYQKYMLTGVIAQHSHNFFMQITIELSILALILMLLVFLYLIKDVCYTLKSLSNLRSKLIIIPLIASFAGVMLEGMVDYIFYNNIVYLVFWFTLALIVCGLNILSSESFIELKTEEVKL